MASGKGAKGAIVTNEKMRLTAPSVPVWAVIKAAEKMRGDGIPVRQSTLVLYAIARLIGIPDDKLAEFSIPRHGISQSAVFSTLEDFEAELNGAKGSQQ